MGEQANKIKSLQDYMKTKGLEEKIDRQKTKAKKLARSIDRKQQTLEEQKQQVAELSTTIDAYEEGSSKLEAKCKERFEEMRRDAATEAADLFKAGHHLKAFLHAVEPEPLCPINYELLTEPTLAADGHTYERASIERWINDTAGVEVCANSPMTGARLEHGFTMPNHALRKLVALYQQWQAQCPQ